MSDFEVLESGAGGWHVRKVGAKLPVYHEPGRDQAVRAARRQIRMTGGGRMAVIDLSGATLHTETVAGLND